MNMMAEITIEERFRKVHECSICLGLYENPKMLKCTHEFCKHCLEGILIFKDDGSAFIDCPLRCDKKTVINTKKTVNDLKASFTTINMLDNLRSDESAIKPPLCTAEENCGKPISVFCPCVSGGLMACQHCYNNHSKNNQNVNHRRLNLSFSQRYGKLMVMCDKHATECTHMCEDNTFLCMYCLQRDEGHKDHTKTPIQTEVDQLRESLRVRIEKHEKSLEETNQCILNGRDQLKLLLQHRKEQCLTSYGQLLNDQEQAMMLNYDNIGESHVKGLQYYQDVVQKLDTELLLRKQEICDYFKARDGMETVSLSSTFNFHSTNPLGDIHNAVKKENPTGLCLSTSTFNFNLADRDEVVMNDEKPGPSRKRRRLILVSDSESDGEEVDVVVHGETNNLVRHGETMRAIPAPQYKFECNKVKFGELYGEALASTNCADNRIFLSVQVQMVRNGSTIPEKYTLSVGHNDVQEVFVHFGRAPSFIAIKPSARFAQVSCDRIGRDALVPGADDPHKRYIILSLKAAFKLDREADSELTQLLNCLSRWAKVTVLTQDAAQQMIVESQLVVFQTEKYVMNPKSRRKQGLGGASA